MASRIARNRIKFFVPYEEQEQFIRSKSKERLLLGANRTGKSVSACIEAISFCLGYRPYLKPSDPDYRTPFTPPVRGIITTESLGIEGTAQQNLIPILEEYIPQHEIAWTKKNQQGVKVQWNFKNRSSFIIMAYEQDTTKFEGSKNHFWYADEPFPQEKYMAISRGLVDYGGYAWFAMTLLGQRWIWDALYSNSDVFKIMVPMTANLKHLREWYGRQEMTGKLLQSDIDDFTNKLKVSGTDEGEILARLTGRPRHLSGAIINNFDYDVHVIEPRDIPKNWTFYEAIDVHPKKPFCIAFMAVDPKGTRYIYKVLYIKATISEICEAIIIERHGRTPHLTLIDPLAVMDDPQTNTSILNDFVNKSGGRIMPQTASKDKERGIHMIREALYHDDEHGIRPTLYIFKTEQEGINQLRNWSYHKDTEKAAKEDDDFPENLYRLMLVARYIQPYNKEANPQKKIIGLGS